MQIEEFIIIFHSGRMTDLLYIVRQLVFFANPIFVNVSKSSARKNLSLSLGILEIYFRFVI